LGDAPLEPIVTKFGNSVYLTDIINRSKFGSANYPNSGFSSYLGPIMVAV